MYKNTGWFSQIDLFLKCFIMTREITCILGLYHCLQWELLGQRGMRDAVKMAEAFPPPTPLALLLLFHAIVFDGASE